jgi:cell division protein FtsW
MPVQSIQEKRKLSFLRIERVGEIDYVLFSIVIIFYGLGIVMVFSASVNEGMKLDDYTYFLGRQIMWVIISFISCIIFMFIDPAVLERHRKLLVWGAVLLLLALLFPPLARAGIVHSSRRWFRFGDVGFQPSEFAKAVLVIYLSSILTKKGERINDFYRGFLPPFIVVSGISFLVLLEPDFSTAFVLFFVSILMFFIMGIRSLSIISLLMVSVPAAYLMISGKGYRRERIMGFLNPWSDPADKGYQIIQSFKAFAYGGVFGVGLGKSIQKLRYLPIPHTDFIFAVIAEEMGFFGVILVIILYMLFAYRGLKIAYSQRGSYEFLLAFGITSLIVWEAVFNIAVVTGLIPSTGISLPFLSYGGSSLLVNSVLAGILLNLSKNNGRRPWNGCDNGESVYDDRWVQEN